MTAGGAGTTIGFMVRLLLGVAATFVLAATSAAQSAATLHIVVTLLDGDQHIAPVPRHALLISDNPATAPPRRVVTGPDGTVDVRLRPGNYTVESDQPVAFQGRAFQWTQDVDVPASGVVILALTAANADSGDIAAASPGAPGMRVSDPSMTLQRWNGSVAALWTPTSRASAFVFDSRGLLATSRRAIGDAESVEVQFTTSKVPGRVVAADAATDVAIVRVDAALASSVPPVPLPCGTVTIPAEGDELFAMGVPLRSRQDRLSSGEVKRIEGQVVEADLRLPAGNVGGPVFSESAELVGLSSDPSDARDRRRDFRVVTTRSVCALASAAEQQLQSQPPGAQQLPVEPSEPVPETALTQAAARRAGSLSPYLISTSDFDVAFITPVMVFAAQQPMSERRTTSADTHRSPLEEIRTARQMDFENWSEYVADSPRVLLVRITPKVTEGFLRTLARGAAVTQGIALPPMGQAKARLSRLRAFCGSAEVTPIHALTIVTPMTGTQTFEEGLYVYEPGSLAPSCGSVSLELFTRKAPEKADTRTVDASVLSRIEQDFAAIAH